MNNPILDGFGMMVQNGGILMVLNTLKKNLNSLR